MPGAYACVIMCVLLLIVCVLCRARALLCNLVCAGRAASHYFIPLYEALMEEDDAHSPAFFLPQPRCTRRYQGACRERAPCWCTLPLLSPFVLICSPPIRLFPPCT